MSGAVVTDYAGASPVNAIAFAATPGSANHGQEPRVDAEKAGSGRSGRSPDFQAEGVTLYLADNREVRDLLAADALISDPPYGMDWNTNTKRFSGGQVPNHRRRGDGRDDWGAVAEDTEPFDPSPWLEYPRVVLWGSNHYGARLPVGTTLIWCKKPPHLFGTFLSDAEVAWMKTGHGTYCYLNPREYMATQQNKLHPTQKPVGLMAWCMERAKVPVGALVADPYTGSGTTAIACLRTGRRFVGCEKDPIHFATAVARIQKELAQGDLFLGGGGAEQAGDGNASTQSGAGSPSEKLTDCDA